MSSWPPPSPAPPPPPFPPPPAFWPEPTPRPPLPTLPLRAAIAAVVVTVVVLVGNRVLITSLADRRWPVAVYIVLSAVVAYGPLALVVRWIVRRWGIGSMRDDLGFAVRAVDLGWGPVTWIAAFGAQVVMGVVVLVTRIPLTSNTEGIGAGRSDEGYVIALLVMAVVAAPFVEELVFRGVVLRGLASRMNIWIAVPIQGVLFGLVHVQPEAGRGNVGLVLILSAVGAVFGGATVLVRRLAPAMIAHALVNAIALTLVLTGVADRLANP